MSILHSFDEKTSKLESDGVRLHVGCGTQSLPGWVNIDSQQLPGVDRVLDVRSGLPYSEVRAIFAEHFLEHLTLDEGLRFLAEARRVLSPTGILRLSTPNLDWVYLTHYQVGEGLQDLQSIHYCLQLNKAFHAWGHQFLYNAKMLAAACRSVGFGDVSFCRYGESEVQFLRKLERHEKSDDVPELPHVLIAEAAGYAAPVPLPADWLAEHRSLLLSR